jgi:nucleoside 2-deoxyribosyltransferase
MSCVTRSATELGQVLDIEPGDWDELLSTAPDPKDVERRARMLLRTIANRSQRLGEHATITFESDGPGCFAASRDEFQYLIRCLKGRKWIDVNSTMHDDRCEITAAGWAAYQSPETALAGKAFVAMWFNDETAAAWTDGLGPGIRSAGYRPIRLDLEEHNDMIDDRIQAEIIESRFLVADLTGHRNGVYFEAGFAHGRGIPVIWTCRKDHADKTHFDTRQYNRIEWDSPKGLAERLNLRIRATIGQGPLAPVDG